MILTPICVYMNTRTYQGLLLEMRLEASPLTPLSAGMLSFSLPLWNCYQSLDSAGKTSPDGPLSFFKLIDSKLVRLLLSSPTCPLLEP